jgi:hypothetical protein
VQQIKSFGQPAVAMIDHPLISALITVLPIDTPV